MANLTNADFMSPYEVGNYLQGVIEGRKTNKRTFLQSHFGDVDTFETPAFNADREKDQKNIGGQYVHPRADAGYIDLPDYGHTELYPAYSKEGIQTDDLITLDQREMGDPLGQVNIMANDAKRLNKKLANALSAFDNLKEQAAADILFNAAHTASGPKAAQVAWNFGRTVALTDAAYLAGYVPQIDLTTLDGNGAVGKRAWDSTGGTKAPTPYLDVKKMVETAQAHGQVIEKLIMSPNAYQLLEDDITKNYSKAADTTIIAAQRIELKVLPEIANYQDATFRRTLGLGNGYFVDIYTYTATYHARNDMGAIKAGEEVTLVPVGKIVAIPARGNQFLRYGRIQHRKAQWQAMQVWINTWEDGKTGEFEQELHTSFVMGLWNPNAVVSWKVSSI